MLKTIEGSKHLIRELFVLYECELQRDAKAKAITAIEGRRAATS